MSKTPDIDKAYVSPYDKFLRTFDAKHAPTASQQLEKAKHDKIVKQRDKKIT
ncbi:MAG: hypothetical protein QNK11_01885 [Legionella sp.]|nr:hypothetical protein [Legionella sp.]